MTFIALSIKRLHRPARDRAERKRFVRLFRPKTPPLLGLDISSTAVKLIELGGNRDQLRLKAYAAAGLPPEAVIDKQVTDPDAVGAALRQAWERAETRTRNIALAVGGSTVITKTIPMPEGLDERELEQQIRVEADQYIPFPLDDVAMDFEVLGPHPSERHMNEVFIAACRNDTIEGRVAAVEIAGLKCRLVDLESRAVENACGLIAEQLATGEDADSAVAFIDVGATTTTLNIMHRGKITYSREQAFGGKLLTEEIMHRYELSYEEAGKAKRVGGLPDDYADTVLQPFVTDTVHQVQRGLQFFFSSQGSIDRIRQIILAGGCASISGIDRAIESATEIPTRIADPFGRMSVELTTQLKRLQLDAPSLMTACGLALRRFDA